tara:strand:- start:3071 stop:3628 length:558 start_codon:yes stop_codon:yes gene_type:complete
MIKKKILFLIFFLFFNNSYASIKTEILKNLKITNNLMFNFEQTINGKKQSGECIVEYPKKIFCSYELKMKKIIVSDGKSLIVKNITSNQTYFYPLKKTPFELLLDKDFLINELKKSKKNFSKGKKYIFSIEKENIFMNLFFDIENYYLIGWQTEDIYQNKVTTNLFNLKKNQIIDKKIFKISGVN